MTGRAGTRDVLPRDGGAGGIPHAIHQTWVSEDVPEAWQGYQASWQRHHPRWTYRLWTDADIRAFVAEHDAWFLPIFDAYPEPIMRVDAFRYFLMSRLGGVYADMDFECLRPLDALLSPHELVMGVEPDAHAGRLLARERGLERVVCNAFLASRPGHPFWEHVIRQLVARHREPGVLDATGPFMLTAALESWTGAAPVHLTPSVVLYPRAAPARGEEPAPAAYPQDAHAVHHWAGSWIRDRPQSLRAAGHAQIPFRITDRVRPVVDGELNLAAARERAAAADTRPLVSCLMVTARRPALATRAIRCFQAQTYAHRELVIVDDDPDAALERQVAALGDDRIRHVRLAPADASLGALRNVAVEHARGELLAQWDDDDLYDPERVEVQVAALESAAADICLPGEASCTTTRSSPGARTPRWSPASFATGAR